MSRYTLLVLLAFTFIVGCGDSDTPTGTGPFGQQSFPLAMGNRWEYQLSGISESSDPSLYLDYSFSADVTWEIAVREQIEDRQAYRFDITHRFLSGPQTGDIGVGQTWFTMQGDTLMSVASRNISTLDPVGQLSKAVGRQFLAQDSWETVALIFALKVGESWDYWLGSSGPWTMDRKSVIENVKITVPAGTFEAFKVVRTVTNSTGQGDTDLPVTTMEVDQWFSSVGLVKVIHRETSVQIPTDQGMEPTFDHQLSVHMELQGYYLESAGN